MDALSTLPVKDLHTRLNFSEPLDYPTSSLHKSLVEWKMDLDDAPIFRYLYRNFQPRRHLEFGTWQGEGVLYCLQECEATVWTINLLEGEQWPNGDWAYPAVISGTRLMFGNLFSWFMKEGSSISNWAKTKRLSRSSVMLQTDAFGFIGRRYLEAGLGHRVCQIYCDSRQWDIHNYPPGFFDTALIDGGHTEDIVMSDTRKACRLVRSGGMILWHDFCPRPDVQQACRSTVGVMNAIQSNWDWLCEQMADLFWIDPSWILLGIKK